MAEHVLKRRGLSHDDIIYVRKGFQKKYAENLKEGTLYDKRDLERFESDNDYVLTFMRGKQRLDEAIELVHESLKWRQESKINDVTEETFDRDMWEMGAIFFHNEDKDGSRILTVKVNKYRKDMNILPIVKQAFSFHLEQHFIETPHDPVVVLFDMQDAGLGNLDMELVKYVINSFKYYYPCLLSYMLVFEMPWILNAAWRIIKTWLSAEAASKMKFVTKNDIQAYINKDQLLEHMGGTDKYKYKYIPGGSRTAGDGSPNDSSAARKRVTFADQDPAVFRSVSLDDKEANTNSNAKDINSNAKESKPQSLSISPATKGSLRMSSSPMAKRQNRDENSFIGRLLTISPAEVLEFTSEESGKEAYDIISLSNTLPFSVAYKVKTTSPEKYRVRPSSGIVKAGSCIEVNVYLQAGNQNNTIQKDKFLIMGMEVADDSSNISELWKTVPRESIMEHRLRCVHTVGRPSPDSPVKEANLTAPELMARMSKKMDNLLDGNARLEIRVRWLIWSQIFLVLAVIVAVVLFYVSGLTDMRQRSCEASFF